MARVLPPLLLLLLTLNPGGASSPTLAQDCNAADIVVKKRETQVIMTTDTEESEGYFFMYVKPENDFEGVRLDLLGSDGTYHTAWFPAKEKCFPHNDKWQLFRAWTWIHSDRKSLGLAFSIGTCRKECEINIPTQSHMLIVVAHGPSKWIKKNPPSDCDIIYVSKTPRPDPLPTCQDPPSTTTPETPTTNSTSKDSEALFSCKLMIIIAASTAGVVVVAVAVVVVVCWKWKSVTSHEVRFQSQPANPNDHLQSTIGHGRTSEDQDIDCEVPVLPDHTMHRVMIPQSPKEEENIYDEFVFEHRQRAESPIYQNVTLYDNVAFLDGASG